MHGDGSRRCRRRRLARRAARGRSALRALPAQARVWRTLAGAHRRARTGLRPARLRARAADGAPREAGRTMTERTVTDLLTAAEPTTPASLGTLVERLSREGRLRGARRDRRAIGASGLADVAIRGVTHDSRAVRPGSLFVAVRGLHVDGHGFVVEAATRGAAAALVERPVPEGDLPPLVVERTPET